MARKDDDEIVGPLAQIGFCNVRASNLKNIQKQLMEEQISKIDEVLHACNSSYHNTSQAMVTDFNNGTLFLVSGDFPHES